MPSYGWAKGNKEQNDKEVREAEKARKEQQEAKKQQQSNQPKPKR